jgi:hypothetical protein
MSTVTTTREQLRELVDNLPEYLLQDAIWALTHIEVDDEPLSDEEIANLKASAEDFKHGRVVAWEDFKRQQGL